jgi:hypothetical protein
LQVAGLEVIGVGRPSWVELGAFVVVGRTVIDSTRNAGSCPNQVRLMTWFDAV